MVKGTANITERVEKFYDKRASVNHAQVSWKKWELVANQYASYLETPGKVLFPGCGMGEVIINGENGFLVPVRDPDSMVEAIKNFKQLDNSRKMIIVNNARETIIDHHQHSDQIDKFSSLYNHIIK